MQALGAYEAGLARNPENGELSRTVSSLRRELGAEGNESGAITTRASKKDKVRNLGSLMPATLLTAPLITKGHCAQKWFESLHAFPKYPVLRNGFCFVYLPSHITW